MQVVAGWLVAFRKDGGGFGAVEYTAATECDDEVALVFPDEPDAVFTFADVGVWTDFAVGDFDERPDDPPLNHHPRLHNPWSARG